MPTTTPMSTPLDADEYEKRHEEVRLGHVKPFGGCQHERTVNVSLRFVDGETFGKVRCRECGQIISVDTTK